MRKVDDLVSVIIPNYNGERYLAECLDSVLAQTHRNIEIVVVDDCSSDLSKDIISEYACKHRNIKPIYKTSNQGVSSARNSGIKASSGKFITTLDSDDIYCPSKVEAELKEYNIRGIENAVIYSSWFNMNEKIKKRKKFIGPHTAPVGRIFYELLYQLSPVYRDIFFTREAFYSAGGYDEDLNLWEDWDLQLRLAKKYPHFYSAVVGVGYRRHQNGLSFRTIEAHIAAKSSIFKKYSLDSPLMMCVYKRLHSRKLVFRLVRKIAQIRAFRLLVLVLLPKNKSKSHGY